MAKKQKKSIVQRARNLSTVQLASLFIIFLMVVSSVSACVLYLV